MNTFNIIIGDSSNDGHGMTTYLKVSCNITSEELADLYKETKQKVGVAPDDFCKEWEDNEINAEGLKAMGLLEVYQEEWGLDEEDLVAEFFNDDFIRLLIVYLKHHNPDLILEINIEENDWDTGMGYGCFFK